MVDMSKIRMFLYLREIEHTKCVWRFNCNFFFCLSFRDKKNRWVIVMYYLRRREGFSSKLNCLYTKIQNIQLNKKLKSYSWFLNQYLIFHRSKPMCIL